MRAETAYAIQRGTREERKRETTIEVMVDNILDTISGVIEGTVDLGLGDGLPVNNSAILIEFMEEDKMDDSMKTDILYYLRDLGYFVSASPPDTEEELEEMQELFEWFEDNTDMEDETVSSAIDDYILSRNEFIVSWVGDDFLGE